MSERVNIFNLGLNREQVELSIDTEADAFARAAPPDDGLWLVVLQPIADGDFIEAQDRNGDPYYACDIMAKFTTPARPDLDGREMTDFYVSTMVFRSSGTCRAAGVLRALRQPIKPKTTHEALMQQLAKALKGSPSCQIETQWEARVATGQELPSGKPEYRTLLRGMRRFPLLEKPGPQGQKHNHVIYWDSEAKRLVPTAAQGEDVAAMSRIIRYAPVGGKV